ncbi:Glycosyl hydrolases related to GH101 family, GHL1-GHL3 [Bordetella sputigena]
MPRLALLPPVLRFLLLCAAALAAAGAQATPPPTAVTLRNPLWTVELRPQTLAIRVLPPARGIDPGLFPLAEHSPAAAGKAISDSVERSRGIEISSGVPAHPTQDLRTSPTQATWQWDQGRYRLAARLDGADLTLSIQARDAGRLAILRQPAVAMGRALALPMAEGHYIPAGDARWRDFLLRDMAEFDTSADLSLPLWTLDHGDHTLSWILENRYDNVAAFTRDGTGLAMSLDHVFTALAPDAPMTLVLHLGAADPLAGARRHRARLLEQGRLRALDEKIKAIPAAAGLPGASHLYLWGSGLLAPKDVRDWPGFLARLDGAGPLSTRLRAHMDNDLLATIRDAAGKPEATAKAWLIRGINDAFDALARGAWQTAAPDPRVLASRYGEIRREAARAFGPTLSPDPARWGAGVSIDTMQALQRAGLRRLWLGLGQGWEGGLWHPEAIAAGVRAGYLVAPYDSYETALPPGQQPSWASAQLGAAAYRDCGIERADGSMQPGFQGAGRYTDPDCVRPWLQARIRAILDAVAFNSWFLDVYATGMAFDNHAAGRAAPRSRYVAESARSLRWLADALGLPAGSEGGNAAADDILFAHGMQTPVIGWTDRDLHGNARSPYFLGHWYPEDEPAKFFKPVRLKEPYAAIHFDPATRLPLYQAVYHGAVITTHHWLFDNLKLRNVARENTLIQLLYNVPPLYHVSSGTLAGRLPEITRHDAFFRPLHERLATQALAGFSWLTRDRRVQRTVFEDGTSLVANMRAGDYRHGDTVIPGWAIAAFVPGQSRPLIHRATTRFPDDGIS